MAAGDCAVVRTLPLTRPTAFATVLTWWVAALLTISSAAGLVFGPRGLYDTSEPTFPALIGQDAVALVFGLPLLIGSAILARRGSVRGLIAWMGALFYVAYFWYFYVIGIRFSSLFIVHIALVSMSMYGALYLFFALDLTKLMAHVDRPVPTRLIGGFLMATALAFSALWLGLVVSRLFQGAELDLVTRYVIAIDGVVLLPVTFFGGLWLWRGQPVGFALAGVLLVKVLATFLTLVATTIVSVRQGHTASLIETSMYVAGLLTAVVLTVRYLRVVADVPAPTHPVPATANAPRQARGL